MSDKKLVPLLERFGIPIPDKIEDYNLIGVDYGDGEFSAAFAQWDGVREEHAVRGLAVHPDGILLKNPNAHYISPTKEMIIYDAAETEVTQKDKGIRYYNFKKCVGTEEAKCKYVKDDHTVSDLTYEQVMANGFRLVMNAVFRSDAAHMLDAEKPTIILVGCPSSAGWEHSELAYAKLLKKSLKLPKYMKKPVYVAVHKESNAALAREIDPKLKDRRIKKGEVIVILDNGSSTFDITVVGVKGIPKGGEDSYQFGGNLLDENLLKLMIKKCETEHPNQKFLSRHGHKLGLRIAKEGYYGKDGTLFSASIYQAALEGEKDGRGRSPKFTFQIDDAVMDEALETMPVTAYHYTGSTGSMIKKEPLRCASWLDGCRQIYEAFYQEMKGHFVKKGKKGDARHPFVPDRIILSGGVSVMPQVQKIIEEVFGTKPVLTNLPNYSVSEGLAYVLITEVRKGQYYRELIKEIPKKLPNAASLQKVLISESVDTDWDIYKSTLREWSKSSKDRSVKDWYQDYFLPKFEKYNTLGGCVQKGVDAWYQKEEIEKKVSKYLKEKFDKMFPDYVDVFQYTLPKLDFSSLSGVQVTISTSHAFFFGNLTMGESKEYIISDESYEKKRDKEWRQRAYQNFLAEEQKIRKGGGIEIPYYYKKEHLFGLYETQEKTDVPVSYDGLEHMEKEGITEKVAEKIRKEVLEQLHTPLKEYVEMITPYFNMTAREQ